MQNPLCRMPNQMTRRYHRVFLAAFFNLLWLLSPAVCAADVSTRIDRSNLALNETLQLVLESDGKPSARPDLSVLEADFEILDRRTSHNVSVVNGARSERHLLILRLRPKRAGALRIPSISFGDMTTESLPLSVAVPPAGTTNLAAPDPTAAGTVETAPAPTVVLEAELQPPEAYTGQQLVLTAKVFMGGPVPGSRLQDPRSTAAEILPLGEDRYKVTRDGQSFQVYERRYALFARKPGRLQIGPLVLEGWMPGATAVPLGGGYPSSGQPVLARSEVLVARILPPPEGTDADDWLPARGLTLSEPGPQTYSARPGHPIERRIQLRVDGIMARHLPAIAVQAPYQLTQRQEQPGLWDERRRDGVIGTRKEIVRYTAQEPGRYRLPPIELDWWNTTAHRWETAVLPARDLVVSAAPSSDRDHPASIANRTPTRSQSPGATDETEPGTGMTEPPVGTPREAATSESRIWVWVTILLALAWIATMGVWWRSKRRAVETAQAPQPAEPPRKVEEANLLRREIDAVRTAYEAGNAGAAREALLAWAQRAIPEQTPSNLARLAQRCPQPLRDQILLLEQAFFSPAQLPWERQPVWEGLEGFAPTPLEEPASFRRGKPIRRRAADPDAE